MGLPEGQVGGDLVHHPALGPGGGEGEQGVEVRRGRGGKGQARSASARRPLSTPSPTDR